MFDSRPRITVPRRSLLSLALGALGAAALRGSTGEALADSPAAPGASAGAAPSGGRRALSMLSFSCG